MDARHSVGLTAALITAVLSLTSCGDSATAPGGSTAIAFRAATGGASTSRTSGSVASDAVSSSHSGDPGAPTLTVEGGNGRLTIASVHFVVSEFELERAGSDGECGDDHAEQEPGGDDVCEEFDAPMQFLELPLSGEDAVVVRQEIPAGTYDELDFEIDDLEDDEGDDRGARVQELLAEIHDAFPNWPEEASLRIHGTFTPKNESGDLQESESRDFTAYFRAEVEIEKELSPPLEVTDANGSVTVTVDPRVWFERADGTVADLSAFDFDPATGGPVPELEVESEHEAGEAFTEVESED